MTPDGGLEHQQGKPDDREHGQQEREGRPPLQLFSDLPPSRHKRVEYARGPGRSWRHFRPAERPPGQADGSPAWAGGDRKAILIAALCFVHCVAGPLLLSFAGFAAAIGLSERLEPLFVLTSGVWGCATLVPAYRRRHGRFSCLALFAGGLLCLLARKHVQWRLFPEAMATAAGAGLIVAAHALNLKFSRQCRCCEPPASRPGVSARNP